MGYSGYGGDPPFIAYIGLGVLLLGFVLFAGMLKKWSYDECLRVGHSPTYCTAQALGCVGRR